MSDNEADVARALRELANAMQGMVDSAVDKALAKQKAENDAGYLTAKEAAKLIKMTTRHITNLIKKDAIPYHRAGHALRFKRGELETWMDERGRKKSG